MQTAQRIACGGAFTVDRAPWFWAGLSFIPTDGVLDALEEALLAGDATLDANTARVCVDKVGSAAPCWGPSAAGFVPVVECEQAVSGRKPDGASCRSGQECAAGTCGGTTCPGTCSAGARAGQSCGFGHPCASGYECGPTTGVCVALKKCASDSGCAANEICAIGYCRTAGGALGDACQISHPEPGQADGCGRDLYCDGQFVGSTGTCRPRVAAGETCGVNPFIGSIGVTRECAGHMVCAGFAMDSTGRVTQTGHCAAPGDVGDACQIDHDFSSGYAYGDCLLDLMCDSSTHLCHRLPGVGERCHLGRCDMGSECGADDVCVRAPSDGESCPSQQGGPLRPDFAPCLNPNSYCSTVCKDATAACLP
ncbi:MAG: hypothetical protein LC689_06100 [Myxococcales bacterium]|nr:hypothetical protein [Myxococcales bacterium]